MSTDPNYTDPEQSRAGTQAGRVGDMTGEPPTNVAPDRDKASKMANLLEGLEFPATKEEILAHVNGRSPAAGNRINDVFEAIQNNLKDGRQYASAYDTEVAAGLVKKAGDEKPYARDRALNRANNKRIGESVRTDPYEQASGGPASARNVSPNTPKGEDL